MGGDAPRKNRKEPGTEEQLNLIDSAPRPREMGLLKTQQDDGHFLSAAKYALATITISGATVTRRLYLRAAHHDLAPIPTQPSAYKRKKREEATMRYRPATGVPYIVFGTGVYWRMSS